MLDAILQDQVQRLFRRVTREVWIVTAADGTRRGGLTVTWLSAASLDPQYPVVLIGIAPQHATAPLIEVSGCFGAHLMRADQVECAWRFASASSRDVDKFAGTRLVESAWGVPVLADCLASVECRVTRRLATVDRTYFWGEVVASREQGSDRESLGAGPLTDHAFFSSLNDAQRATLGELLRADLELQRQARKTAGNGDDE